jgi:tryptophanase
LNTRIEPYRIKAVEPLPLTTRAERERALDAAGWNLFRLPARLVTIDLLTDSGVVAMSARQWGALMEADESYAGAESFARFEAAVRDVTGFAEVIPAHQGRAAERLLFEALVRPGDVVPGNTHFDTTRANLERLGARPVDLPVPCALDPESEAPFKGDLHLEALGNSWMSAGRRWSS